MLIWEPQEELPDMVMDWQLAATIDERGEPEALTVIRHEDVDYRALVVKASEGERFHRTERATMIPQNRMCLDE